jgi:hypothetical protein
MDRIDALEQKVGQLQREARWYRLGGAVAVLALAGVLMMGAKTDKVGEFDYVVAGGYYVENDKGIWVAALNSEDGVGRLAVSNAQGKNLIYAGSSNRGDGLLGVFNAEGKEMFYAGSSNRGNGGLVGLRNKYGEHGITLKADDYGNGEVGVWDRKGEGRTLTPGP